ncbi:MAG: imidazoleglycerol-phosphate dehydratase HisB [Deferribacterota bacterium]|nr:imidazoleglycerol-phosphate dehydratase HisB [Deferribacterota bacterium]
MRNIREAQKTRETKETSINIYLNLDNYKDPSISTGIPFFDHMLTQIAVHSSFTLELKAKGDIEVDFHHTVEDTGIVFGQVLNEALNKKVGIARYGFALLPLDETLIEVALDISGRAFLNYDVQIERDKIGNFDTELIYEFLHAFVINSNVTLHITKRYGKNSHHIAEAIFKGLAHSLKNAVKITDNKIPSSKGLIGQ